MSKIKRLGWAIKGDNLLKFAHNHSLSELEQVPIYRTKRGLYFHNHIRPGEEYLVSPVRVRITIEEI